MNYESSGQWVESKAEIELTSGGAAATNGQHKVFFAANVNVPGAVEMTTPDGKRLRSHILGLSYFDTASGKSVLIAAMKDSIGQLLPSGSEVLYPDACTDFRVDVRFRYSLAGLEQDIVLRERPPAPAVYGFDPATTVLQVLTEFMEAPTPQRDSLNAAAAGSLGDEFWISG